MGKSPKEVFADFQVNMPKLQKAIPEVAADFVKKLMPDALKDGVLTTKVKELIALGIAVSPHATTASPFMSRSVSRRARPRRRLPRPLGVAIVMGGGPALTYSTFVMQAIEDFAPKA